MRPCIAAGRSRLVATWLAAVDPAALVPLPRSAALLTGGCRDLISPGTHKQRGERCLRSVQEQRRSLHGRLPSSTPARSGAWRQRGGRCDGRRGDARRGWPGCWRTAASCRCWGSVSGRCRRARPGRDGDGPGPERVIDQHVHVDEQILGWQHGRGPLQDKGLDTHLSLAEASSRQDRTGSTHITRLRRADLAEYEPFYRRR